MIPIRTGCANALSSRGSLLNVGLIVTSFPKLTTRATSSFRRRPKSSEPAARSSGTLPSMLPDTSSITMRRMGCGVLSN